MAQSASEEIRMLIEACYPYSDASRVRISADRLVFHQERDRQRDPLITKRIPEYRPVTEIPLSVKRLLVAIAILTGCVDELEAWRPIRQRVPVRPIAELVDRAHQSVHEVILGTGQATKTLVALDRTTPTAGEGKIGINPGTGGRRGAPAHLPNLYEYVLDDGCLEMARAYVAQHGYPEVVYPPEKDEATELIPEEELPEENKVWARLQSEQRAAQAWEKIKEDLGTLGIREERLNYLLIGLQPVSMRYERGHLWPTLTIAGPITYEAIQLINRVCDYRLAYRIGPPA